MEQTKSLAQKLAAAVTVVGGRIKPEGRNDQQNYSYIRADDVLYIAGQALAEQGITIVPRIVSEDIKEISSEAYGKTRTRYQVMVEFLITITDGNEEMSARWLGLGVDYSSPDKALYKALTSGHKYFLMKLLVIGAGNPDGEHEAPPPPPPEESQPKRKISDKHMKKLHALGVEFYGREQWEVKRPQIIEAVTDGRTSSSAKLYDDEAAKLISIMMKKVEEKRRKEAPLVQNDTLNNGELSSNEL